MENINEYKKRFYNLMESTLGDVKPLISEDAQFNEYVDLNLESFFLWVFDDNNNKLKVSSKPIADTFTPPNEYSVTIKEGSFRGGEEITITIGRYRVQFDITKDGEEIQNKQFVKFLEPMKYRGDVKLKSDADFPVDRDTASFSFNMPKTQEEFDKEQPFKRYVDITALNVKGGKVRFSVIVPSTSTIVDTSNPISTLPPTEPFGGNL